MQTISIYDAKANLSQPVDRAAGGVDVVVSRNGKPLVRITQLESAKRSIKFGVLKGRIKLTADFDARLPDAVLAGLQGR